MCLILPVLALAGHGCNLYPPLCSNYNMRMWFNGTVRGREGPPSILRLNQARHRHRRRRWAPGHHCQPWQPRPAALLPLHLRWFAFCLLLHHCLTIALHPCCTLQPLVQGINRATNAFLKWSLKGEEYQTWLLGLMEMPKVRMQHATKHTALFWLPAVSCGCGQHRRHEEPAWHPGISHAVPAAPPPPTIAGCLLQGGSRLSLDFSSLLGPLFFSWLLQLLLPMMLNNLVYEKEKRLRTIMKMHGLGDAAYWAIQVGARRCGAGRCGALRGGALQAGLTVLWCVLCGQSVCTGRKGEGEGPWAATVSGG